MDRRHRPRQARLPAHCVHDEAHQRAVWRLGTRGSALDLPEEVVPVAWPSMPLLSAEQRDDLKYDCRDAHRPVHGDKRRRDGGREREHGEQCDARTPPPAPSATYVSHASGAMSGAGLNGSVGLGA